MYWSRDALTEVTFDNGITSIGKNTFYKAYRISSVTIPGTVTAIGNGAFQNCEGITDLVIADSVTSLGKYAFKNCSGLKHLSIPISLNAVVDAKDKNDAFYGCGGIEKIVFTPGNGTGFDYDKKIREHTPWYFSRDSLTEAYFSEGITALGMA